MPIKGMTTTNDLKPQLARLGKLRKGGEKTGNRPGPDLDHFRADFTDDEVSAIFNSYYPDKPKNINIVLWHDTLENNFDSWIEVWNATSLVLRSDGEYDYQWLDGSRYKKGKRPTVLGEADNEGKRYISYNGKMLKAINVGRLEFLIPELLNEGIVGSVTMETHSINDIVHIANILHTVESGRGSLRGAEFIMKRVEENISTPGFGNNKGKRSRTDKWLVKLQPPREMFEVLIAGAQPKMIGGGKKELPPPPTNSLTG